MGEQSKPLARERRAFFVAASATQANNQSNAVHLEACGTGLIFASMRQAGRRARCIAEIVRLLSPFFGRGEVEVWVGIASGVLCAWPYMFDESVFDGQMRTRLD